RDRDLAQAPVGAVTRVHHHSTVGELDGLVLVHGRADELAALPGLAVVVGVHRVGLDDVAAVRGAHGAGVLLHEPARVRSVAQLDPLAAGGEHALHVAGHGLVHTVYRLPVRGLRDVRDQARLAPCHAAVVGTGDGGAGDLPVRVVIAPGAAVEALVLRIHEEGEEAARLPVEDETRVGVPVLARAGLAVGDELQRPPGLAVVRGAPGDDRVGVG